MIVDAALAAPESQEALLSGLLAETPEEPPLLGACLQIGAEGSLKVERREDLVERVWERFLDLGSALWSAGDPAAAVEVHRESVELLRALASLWEGASSSDREAAAKDRPATVRELAIGLYKLGSALGATKDREDGCASVLEALELYEALTALTPHLQRERDMILRLAQRLGCLGQASMPLRRTPKIH